MKLKYILLFIISTICLMANGTIDLTALENFANQFIPNYIDKDNTRNNPISNEGATLGKVLFYDKNLSLNNTIACASCHKQEKAFGDDRVLSEGLDGGLTGRHSMRLVNARFSDERRFFWDERARDLEEQTTLPIQDHIEMGFSNTNGNPGIDSLLRKLNQIDYYKTLFSLTFGDELVTEDRMQLALAQFIRSIQSFDSKFDKGLAQVNNINQPFPNYTIQENQGKMIYLNDAECQQCHRAPEFDIRPNSDNNGVIGVAGDPNIIDLENTRAPTLRDLFGPDGTLNGPMMHDGSFSTMREVIDHYNNIVIDPANTNLDNRLRGGGGGPGGNNGNGQNLNLTEAEKQSLEAFLKTLTGSDIYTNEKWSNPFDENDNLFIFNGEALPVELAEFRASLIGSSTLLEWVTLFELDNEGFGIEHKANSGTWREIGFVASYGNSQDRVEYEYVHNKPNFGTNYYRLKQIDFDGNTNYSDIKAIELVPNSKESEIGLRAYPNPFVSRLTLELNNNQNHIRITNIAGQTVYSSVGQNTIDIDVLEWPTGIYFVNVMNDQNKSLAIEKIIKK